MERRLYFVLGDLASNAGVGALVALAAGLLAGETWPGWLAMVAGMAAGTLLALPAMTVLSALFGAMELMLPVMLTAMLAGMAGGMQAAAGPSTAAALAGSGALVGVAVLAVTYGCNARIHARHRRATGAALSPPAAGG